jgi:hypothetical protein
MRLPDWPERLAAHIEAHRAVPFTWGVHDCCTFAAGSVLACTGQWPAGWKWPDAAAAARLLRRLGGLPAAVDRLLPRLAAPLSAQRGDVLLVRAPTGRRDWLAVADAGGWWAPGPDGLVRGSMMQATAAWGVGACHKP